MSTATKIIALVLLICLSGIAAATDIPIHDKNWSLSPDGVEIVKHRGVDAFRINGGRATLKDTSFRNGVIEFDIDLPNKRGFAGVTFRSREGGMAEHFYLRPHLSGMPDANQYQPIFNGNSAWQLLHGTRYSAATPYAFDRWTHVKLVVKGNRMDVYLDSDTPVLHVDPLMHGVTEGGISFSGFMAEFHIANVKVTYDDTVKLAGTAAPLPEMPTGLIKSFQVATTPVAADKIVDSPWLDAALLENQTWQPLAVGETGAANLGRISASTRQTDTLFAKLTITADQDKTIKLRYGFSDKVTLFLNGRAIAQGDNTFQTRDYRYLGTIGLFDGVFLPLKAGNNEVIFAVTEAFGGWGVMAAIDDQTGLSIR